MHATPLLFLFITTQSILFRSISGAVIPKPTPSPTPTPKILSSPTTILPEPTLHNQDQSRLLDEDSKIFETIDDKSKGLKTYDRNALCSTTTGKSGKNGKSGKVTTTASATAVSTSGKIKTGTGMSTMTTKTTKRKKKESAVATATAKKSKRSTNENEKEKRKKKKRNLTSRDDPGMSADSEDITEKRKAMMHKSRTKDDTHTSSSSSSSYPLSTDTSSAQSAWIPNWIHVIKTYEYNSRISEKTDDEERKDINNDDDKNREDFTKRNVGQDSTPNYSGIEKRSERSNGRHNPRAIRERGDIKSRRGLRGTVLTRAPQTGFKHHFRTVFVDENEQWGCRRSPNCSPNRSNMDKTTSSAIKHLFEKNNMNSERKNFYIPHFHIITKKVKVGDYHDNNNYEDAGIDDKRKEEEDELLQRTSLRRREEEEEEEEWE